MTEPNKQRSGSGLPVRGMTHVPSQPAVPTEDQLRTMPLDQLRKLADAALRKQEE
jgi:hypothetical protein